MTLEMSSTLTLIYPLDPTNSYFIYLKTPAKTTVILCNCINDFIKNVLFVQFVKNIKIKAY